MRSALAAMREVTAVSPEPALVIRTRLYESGVKSMSTALDDLFRVTGIQLVKGTAGVRQALSYDRLVLAAGSCLRRPNIPGRPHLHSLASHPPRPTRNTVIVEGGGFTGIEIAAELPGRLSSVIGQDVEVRVIVVEQGAEIGPELGANPRPVIFQALAEQEVETKLGASMMSVDDRAVVTTSGEHIESLTALWTARLEVTPLTHQIREMKDRRGCLHAYVDLRVPSAKDIFVAGDAAFAEIDCNGHYAMMSCQHANAGAVVTEGWEHIAHCQTQRKESANRIEALAAAGPDSPGPTLA
ncbi:uncharacterized protein BDW43DRAFT_302648 [Aspergillus alliaceus]|uniref:uncharacterized protein n=1 Tax=Petromyces alliaceus TaxID=209559 RepID=UPI0012A700B5|nr:uncharacterized protein BDW43DRAFT_302648 [Aspergillus alliaceus]KAB8230222.1 hypothetical protein BDW43DRAFT_302648 [Aspergillus alliaceus]